MKRANINSVADLAGVSTATVSHVINDTRYVTDATKKKVLDAIEQLGYIPSSVARGLASSRSRTIGILFSDIGNPFFVSLYRRIQSHFDEMGYRVRIFNTDEVLEKQESMLRECLSAHLDGLIVAPTGHMSELLNSLTKAYGIPVVLIDRRSPGAAFPLVASDNEQMAYDAVAHLLHDGHRRVGIILGHAAVSTTIDRLTGYRRALEDNGIPLRDEYIFQGTSRLSDNGYSGLMELSKLATRPTAVFTTNSLMTLGALHALRELGLSCPSDMGLVGVDDPDWADIFSPPLSVMRQPTEEMGMTAASILEDLLNEESYEASAQESLLSGKLVIRGSCSERCWQAFSAGINNSKETAETILRGER